jgi:hypothetical protein
MKKQFFFVLACLSLTAATALAQGKLKFKEETREFGKIPQGKPVTHEFVFTNTGSAPVVISNATATCGCTTPEWSKEPIMPGKTGIVKATFNAAVQGQFNKPVTVYTNAETPTVTVYLKGEVVESPTASAVATAPAKTPTAKKKKDCPPGKKC